MSEIKRAETTRLDAKSRLPDGSKQMMRSSFQAETEKQLLSVIALFCYSASLAAVFAVGYSLIALALTVAAQQIGIIYSPHGM